VADALVPWWFSLSLLVSEAIVAVPLLPAVAVFRKRDGVPMVVVAPTDDQRGDVAVRFGAARRLDAVKLAGGNLTCPVWGACWGDGGVAAAMLASALGHRP